MRSDVKDMPIVAAWATIVFGMAQVACLAGLHVASPEFDPAWRVVSEYAHGRYGWLLSLTFLSAGICIWCLAYSIRSQLQTRAGKIGWMLLIASGFGTALAAIFDIEHPLHELCGLVGILGLPAAAMLVSVSLSHTTPWSQLNSALLWAANLTWISVALFALAMGLLIYTYTRTGASTQTAIPIGSPLPSGVIGINGWANRILLIPFWQITVAWSAIQLRRQHDQG